MTRVYEMLVEAGRIPRKEWVEAVCSLQHKASPYIGYLQPEIFQMIVYFSSNVLWGVGQWVTSSPTSHYPHPRVGQGVVHG